MIVVYLTLLVAIVANMQFSAYICVLIGDDQPIGSKDQTCIAFRTPWCKYRPCSVASCLNPSAWNNPDDASLPSTIQASSRAIPR